MNAAKPVLERFIRLVDAECANGCWEWRGCVDHDGYGRFWFNSGTKRAFAAHRAAWVLLRGPIPAGLHIDHLCRNRRCVNPDHLEPVTPLVNARRSQPYRYGEVGPDGLRRFCKNGHEMTGENVRPRSAGGRQCRACMRTYERAYRQRKATK